MRKFFALGLILLSIVLCYGTTIRNGFVWDDHALILRDPLIRSWRLVPEAFNHFLFLDATASSFYRPMQRLSYTLDYALFGLRPAGYHVMSVLFHALAAFALFLALEELLRKETLKQRRWIAFAAALIWAVHPLHSSAVVYVAGRADPLAAMFGFAGLYFALRAGRKEGGGKIVALGLALLFFLGAALSKESGLIFPALWLTVLCLERRWRFLFPAIALIAVVAAAYFALRLGAEHIPPPPPKPASAMVRPILVARAAAEYTGLITFPRILRMERDVETRPNGFNNASITHASWRELQTLLGALVLTGLLWRLWRARKRDRTEFGLWVLALIAYGPVSGVVSLNATVAEHWLYVPLALLLAAVARFLQTHLSSKSRAVQRTAIVAIGCWTVFLAVRTFIRVDDWREHRAFLETTIQHGGDSARMLINLAADQLRSGELDAARANLIRASKKDDEQPFLVINMAALALKQNEFSEARRILSRAVTMPLVAAQAHEMLAVLDYKERGQVDLRRLHLAARTGPPNWSIERRYIEVLVQSGLTREAIEELRHVLQREWYRAESWTLLSRLLRQINQPAAADVAAGEARRYDVRLTE